MAWAAALGGLAGGGSSGAMSFGTSAFNDALASSATKTAWDRWQYARATQYQTAVRDMEQAGLNPILAATQGGAGMGGFPGAQQVSMGGPGDVAGGAARGVSAAKELMATKADLATRKNLASKSLGEATSASAKALADTNFAVPLAEAEVGLRNKEMDQRDTNIALNKANTFLTLQQANQVNANTEYTKLKSRLAAYDIPSARAMSDFDKTKIGEALTKFDRAMERVPIIDYFMRESSKAAIHGGTD